MRAKDLISLGVPVGAPLALAQQTLAKAAAGATRDELHRQLQAVVAAPHSYRDDPTWGELATVLVSYEDGAQRFVPREQPAPFRTWGDDLDPDSLRQMEQACALPVAVRGALMPDAHLGYGLPIGGVLAARNAVIPYAVGMDIACRMKLSVLAMPVDSLARQRQLLEQALRKETSFGVGASFKTRRQHAVMDEDWTITPVTRQSKDRAWAQLGTSGSGNHFVELGELSIQEPELGLEAGTYLALLSHSGSRGAGSAVAGYYSKLALSLHPELPRELQRLAWLALDTAEGQEYWQAMQLMGRYAAANHELIHRHVVQALATEVLADIENHHNFAWLEEHDGETMVVHRKGATPAGEGVLGIIPGSMATVAYVVRGLGNRYSLRSASHGAGRAMSRTQAKARFSWDDLQRFLDERGVEVLAAGIDECPMAYKDIEEVMTAQQDLVQPVARFLPRLVMMAPDGERPEG